MAKTKSILGGSESDVPDGPVRFWFEDPEKVIKKAMSLASQDMESQKIFLRQLANLVAQDEAFRRLLLAEIKEPGKGKKGRSRRPAWWAEFVRMNIEFALKAGLTKTKGMEIAALHLNKSIKTIESIEREGRKP